ncbi:hypothetical protein D9611_002788 [Ephemerocybe angulata]|uniref:Thioesterase domain-containing protein n=1 Tax=Ephemerocybe angulata TaxID=980116 RepID=A0A8H5C462_9AGAR|nr:hypothetical protein D9611_002788 [Tulosesus angulatus]
MPAAASQFTDLPVVDISNVKGNASDETKRQVWSTFKYLLGSPGWFNHSIGDSIQCKEVNVWGPKDPSTASPSEEAPRAETVFEVEVTPDMCNLFGILHGGCTAYLIDQYGAFFTFSVDLLLTGNCYSCSVTSTMALGCHIGEDGTGLSQSMNIVWVEAAPLGAKLRIVNTSMVIRGRVRTCRSELWNGNKLCASGVHSLVNAPKKMIRASLPSTSAQQPPSNRNQPFTSPALGTSPIFAAKL